MLVQLIEKGDLREEWQAETVCFELDGWLRVHDLNGLIYAVGSHLTSVTSDGDTVYIELRGTK